VLPQPAPAASAKGGDRRGPEQVRTSASAASDLCATCTRLWIAGE